MDEREHNRGRIVLGVDDAPEDLLFLRMVITAAGYSFVGASSGTECVQMVTRLQPKLILLDVEMKELDGFSTCKRLRKNREFNQIPIVFLTARNTSFDVKSGLAVGGDDFIVKPFDHAKLLERVRHWISHGPRKR